MKIEAEVPPGNSKRIDLWFVPEHVQYQVHLAELSELWQRLAKEASAIEVWSQAPSVEDFWASWCKREIWLETLRLRDKRAWARPALWHVCAGKPVRILEEFGFVACGMPGFYEPVHRGLRTTIVVVGELPKTRDTLLFRLLGRGEVRRDALRELYALPNDAWERLLAEPWLERLGFEVPQGDLELVDDEELVMDIQVLRDALLKDDLQAWDNEILRHHSEKLTREFEARLAEERALHAEERRLLEAQRAEERRLLEAQRALLEAQLLHDAEAQRALAQRQAEVKPLVHQIERRLGRTLTPDEHTQLAGRVAKHGSEFVADVVMDYAAPDLAVWLSETVVPGNG